MSRRSQTKESEFKAGFGGLENLSKSKQVEGDWRRLEVLELGLLAADLGKSQQV